MYSKLIHEKLFRKRENDRKIQFILENTDITVETFIKAATIAKRNPYHNFGHEIGACEQGIRIAMAENRIREEINIVAIALLFHDASHRGYVQLYDEMRAVYMAGEILDETDTAIIGPDHSKNMKSIRELILATIFPGSRGKNLNPIEQIIQDADLAHLGLGWPYWLWASMGLIEEFNRDRNTPLSPIDFIKNEQEKFINYLSSLSNNGNIYLSAGAQKIFKNPVEEVRHFATIPTSVIEYAHSVRYEDVTLEEFKVAINQLMA